MTAINTQGAKLQRLDTSVSPNAYVDIAGVVSVQGPTGSRQVIDITTLASTYREKQVGIPDLGQVTFDCIFDGGEATLGSSGIRGDFTSGTLRTFKLVLPSSPEQTMQFTAYVLNFSVTENVDDVVRANVTLEITATATFTNM